VRVLVLLLSFTLWGITALQAQEEGEETAPADPAAQSQQADPDQAEPGEADTDDAAGGEQEPGPESDSEETRPEEPTGNEEQADPAAEVAPESDLPVEENEMPRSDDFEDEEFEPGEEISEDYPVPLPSDI
jgi:cytoskeletal protein RodZ